MERDKEGVTGGQAFPSAWVRMELLSTGIERERKTERDRETRIEANKRKYEAICEEDRPEKRLAKREEKNQNRCFP